MAEDKKIRVSADLSQLRALREEATGLQRDLNALQNSSNGDDKAISNLKEQLALLGERNDLEKLYNDLKKQSASSPSETSNLPRTPDHHPKNIERELPEQEDTSGWREPPVVKKGRKKIKEFFDRVGENIEDNSDEFVDEKKLPSVTENPKIISIVNPPESQEEKKKRQKNLQRELSEDAEVIDEDKLALPERKQKFLDSPSEIERKGSSELDDWVLELRASVDRAKAEAAEKEEKRHIARDSGNSIYEEDLDGIDPIETPSQEESSPEEKPKKKKASKKEKIEREVSETPSRDLEIKPASPNGSLSDERENGIDILSFLEKWKSDLAQTDDDRNETLTSIQSLITEINKSTDSISGKIQEGAGGALPPTDGTGEPPVAGGKGKKKDKKDKDPDGAPGAKTMVTAWLAAKGIQAVFDKIAEVIEVVKERHIRTLAIGEAKEYMHPIQAVESFTTYQGKQEADFYRWVPFIGKIAAAEIETIAGAKAQHQGMGLQAAGQLEQQVRPYSQTFGVSNSRAEGVAFREGGYAASALGLDAGEYSAKRAGIVRAGGGKETVSGVRESQSLMAVERLYGMNPQAASQLQGSMRFSEKSDTSTNSSSAVIRIFEQTMRDLKKPFSEIASTIEESLTTFNKTADNILSKAGDFNASTIAGVLAGVRAYTGAEGKQLERYQESFSGQAISQDEVSQALLIRTVSKMDSSLKTYSDVMAKIDKIQEDPEAMRTFLKDLKGLTTTNEQFVNVLKAVFPKLSYTDIKSQVEKPGFSIDALYNKIIASTKKIQKENDRKNQYDKDAASQTVGTLESFDKNYQNDMKGYGASISGSVKEILDELHKIKEKAEMKELLDKLYEYLTAPDSPVNKDLSRQALGLKGPSKVLHPGMNPMAALFHNLFEKLSE